MRQFDARQESIMKIDLSQEKSYILFTTRYDYNQKTH
jgi:hypothetical protein